MSQDKHSYSRIATNIQAWLRPLPSPDAPAMLGNASELMGRSTAAASLQDARLPESVVQFLLDMDRKLQSILGLLGRDQLLQDFPLRATVTEIGGDGVHLVSEEALPLELATEVVIALNPMPLRLVGAVGRVVRVESPEGPQPGAQVFEFTRIREAELDAIIAFVLQEERRHIRERKWD